MLIFKIKLQMAVKESNTTVATVISKEDKKQLLELAKKNQRSLSNLLAHIVKQYLEQEKK